MKTFARTLFSLAAGLFILAACDKDETQPYPVWPDEPETPEGGESGLKPLDGGNIVVAHRGGSTEAGVGFPDNSIAALQYAMSLKCYASECDIYWTKDDNVIVAHADAECKINGLYPWEASLQEIRAKGNLTNGESIPTLEEYLDEVMKEGSCTRLWLDIKNITSPSTLTQYPINACRRACEIISEKKAQNFVEFISTGNATVMASSFNYARAAGVEIGWMSNSAASVYQSRGYGWANMSITYMNQGGGDRTIDEFRKAGIALSVYNADDESTMDYYITNSSSMKAICTNYPKILISKMSK